MKVGMIDWVIVVAATLAVGVGVGITMDPIGGRATKGEVETLRADLENQRALVSTRDGELVIVRDQVRMQQIVIDELVKKAAAEPAPAPHLNHTIEADILRRQGVKK